MRLVTFNILKKMQVWWLISYDRRHISRESEMIQDDGF